MTEKEIKQLQAENAALREEVSRLKDEMVRLVSRNLDLSERFEDDVTLRLHVAAAREMMENNLKRQRNADLQDDGQLLAIIEMKLEQEQPHLNADFDGAALAELMGVSQERLSRLFHHMALYRTPNAYLDNLRTLTAMRLLREKPNYNIATVAEEAGFNNVRTMQRKITDAIDMTPAEYRALFTRDL